MTAWIHVSLLLLACMAGEETVVGNEDVPAGHKIIKQTVVRASVNKVLMGVVTGFLLVLFTTVFYYLNKHNVFRIGCLSDPDASSSEKLTFIAATFLVAVPGCILGVMGLGVLLAMLLRYVTDRKIELVIAFILMLLVYFFFWYLGRRRGETSKADPESDHQNNSFIKNFSLWNIVKMPYQAVMDLILYVLARIIWWTFGWSVLSWLHDKKWPIGLFLFLATSMYGYYLISVNL